MSTKEWLLSAGASIGILTVIFAASGEAITKRSNDNNRFRQVTDIHIGGAKINILDPFDGANSLAVVISVYGFNENGEAIKEKVALKAHQLNKKTNTEVLEGIFHTLKIKTPSDPALIQSALEKIQLFRQDLMDKFPQLASGFVEPHKNPAQEKAALEL